MENSSQLPLEYFDGDFHARRTRKVEFEDIVTIEDIGGGCQHCSLKLTPPDELAPFIPITTR